MTIDIGSRGPDETSARLSNFTAHTFLFDGIVCASMEGLLQSFKFDDVTGQVQVCSLVGFKAKKTGLPRDAVWKQSQTLWWAQRTFARHGAEYQQLLDDAFDALSQNPLFRSALIRTGTATLTHTIGKSDPSDTVLTEHEFCSRLEKIRSRLQS